jgi:hypothetical protein
VADFEIAGFRNYDNFGGNKTVENAFPCYLNTNTLDSGVFDTE